MPNRIRELRETRKMTQLRLSIELEVSQETISAYENGKHFPAYQSLVRLSELFGVSIDYLMGRDTEQGAKHSGLTTEEERLLCDFRELTPHGRELVMAYIQGLSQRK